MNNNIFIHLSEQQVKYMYLYMCMRYIMMFLTDNNFISRNKDIKHVLISVYLIRLQYDVNLLRLCIAFSTTLEWLN